MFRLNGALLRRIGYITDVEGDFSYFQRYVCISRVVKWEEVNFPYFSNNNSEINDLSSTQKAHLKGDATRWAPMRSPNVPRQTTAALQSPASRLVPFPSLESGVMTSSIKQTPILDPEKEKYDPMYTHIIDVSRYRLTFQDQTSHFVFGGDAFDHGADLTFGHVLLDFKRRFPERVHLLLGNRDLNKMVMYPRVALGVAGLEADAAERNCFTLPSLPNDVKSAAAMTDQLRYKDYLQLQMHTDHSDAPATTPIPSSDPNAVEKLVADPITFLQWMLKHKLGSPNAFEHRRHELAELKTLRDSSDVLPPRDSVVVSDSEVADSFFSAAQPGGIYYDYLRLGVLSVVLDGVLFVHGGVNGSNAGFVPSLEVTSYAEQMTAGEWWLPEVEPAAATAAVKEEDQTTKTTSSLSYLSPPTSSTKRRSALEWLSALSSFKAAAFQEWINGTGRGGEALRAYVYPRVVAPHSIVVGTVMEHTGPHHICLPAVAYLIDSGIHTVCGGHQPVGDTPAVVRQPGGFMIVDADTSYCGRGNAFCTCFNRRGAAVMELVFDSGDDGAAPAKNDGSICATSENSVAASLIVHGFRADGTPYEFDLYADLRVGRYVGDGWWVRLPPSVAPRQHAGQYELRRTRDGFRHEDIRWASAEEVDALLLQAVASGQSMVEGKIALRYTKEELAEVRVHRLKTKVSRAL